MNSFRIVALAALLIVAFWFSCGQGPVPADGGSGGGKASAGGSATGGGDVNSVGGGLETGGGTNSIGGGMETGGGLAVDAGLVVDAGPILDSGVVADAGVIVDGGMVADAGTAFDAGMLGDAGKPVDAGVPFDGGVVLEDGESCRTAPDIRSVSVVSPDLFYGFRVNAPYGRVNDYSPYNKDPEPPNCSIVYPVPGNDVAYAITLKPGQRLDLKVSLDVFNAQPSVYVLDSCDPPTIRDGDNTGGCGSNEFSVGDCNGVSCGDAKLTFIHPLMIGGVATQTKLYWVVVDQGIGLMNMTAPAFHLDWKKTPNN
jgi:hypothetical protein